MTPRHWHAATYSAALLIAAITILGWVWSAVGAYEAQAATQSCSLRMVALKERILHLDETLTMSAFMRAATGVESWEQRYSEYEPALCGAIEELCALAAAEGLPPLAAETRQANDRLVAIERQSFQLAGDRKLEAAMELLASPEYKALKATYKSGMDRLSGRLDIALANRLASEHRRKVTSISLAGTFLAILGGAFVMILRRMSQRRDVLMGELDQTRQSERSLAARLQQGIHERERAEEALRHTEEKMMAIRQLAGGVAHDFNNLLCAISGFNSMAMEDLPPDHPVTGHLQEIRTASQRASDLTRQLLAFGQRQHLQAKAVDLDEVVADLESVVRRMMGSRVRLRLIRGSSAVRVLADPEQLRQVILNLARNSIDAMPTGGEVRIEGGWREAKPPMGRLMVADTGVGMNAETQARLFEPFFTTKGMGRGTGLGLSTVHGIVKQSGGNIAVHSEVGRGTTFTVTLPGVLEPAAEPAKAHGEAVAGGPKGILVVDDEEQVRRLAGEFLRRRGFNVLEAANGTAALEQLHEHGREIALLLTDVIMPGMSGTELMRQARDRQPALRVVLMSGFTGEPLDDEDLAGAALVQKPFSPGSLHAAVCAALGSNAAEVCASKS